MRLETFQGICTKCSLKKIHRFDRFGVLRCELCQQSMDTKDLFCPPCGRETTHCKYWDTWTCLACGHARSRGQGDKEL